ncbi:hypothetical protein BD560DRAFT_445833 [Blakeslea trispora]|nr:hypothetical protein BD560DRAFT_445833 [Blakeslea trispora]
MYMTLVVQSSTNSNKRMITTKISFLVRLNKVKWTNSCSIYKETDFSTVRLVCLYFTMVSVSSLFFSGIVLIAGVSAVPKAEVQSLQKMEHYKKMVESNFEIQPRGYVVVKKYLFRFIDDWFSKKII